MRESAPSRLAYKPNNLPTPLSHKQHKHEWWSSGIPAPSWFQPQRVRALTSSTAMKEDGICVLYWMARCVLLTPRLLFPCLSRSRYMSPQFT